MNNKTKELFNLARKFNGMQPGVIVGYLKTIYREGYRDGHAACVDELGLKDGDQTITIDEDEFKKMLKDDPTGESLLMHVYKEVNK